LGHGLPALGRILKRRGGGLGANLLDQRIGRVLDVGQRRLARRASFEVIGQTVGRLGGDLA
jgi:hypothetical protein